MSIYYLGLDIGQSTDHTALAALRRSDPNGESEADKIAIQLARRHKGLPDEDLPIEYQLLALDRLPLGMPYPRQVAEVKARLKQLEGNGVELAIDRTGVGAPVADMFNAVGVDPTGILITGGNEVKSISAGYSVPKRDLVSAAVVLHETGRLKFAKRLKLWQACKDEMAAFERTISESGHDSYSNNARQSPHDDLVLALAMACWLAVEREDKGYWRVI